MTEADGRTTKGGGAHEEQAEPEGHGGAEDAGLRTRRAEVAGEGARSGVGRAGGASGEDAGLLARRAEVPGEGARPGTGRAGGVSVDTASGRAVGEATAGSPDRRSVAPGDTMAAVVRQWQAVRPGLDTRPMEVIGRINRCAALLQQAEDAPLRRAGLTRPEFDVLAALLRTGRELTPSEIARETFSSGAAATKRVKQLTERGLVERRGDTRDRRVAHVRLTDEGRELVDGVLPEQLSYETTVLSGTGLDRQRELAELLGELLGRLEGRLGMPRA